MIEQVKTQMDDIKKFEFVYRIGLGHMTGHSFSFPWTLSFEQTAFNCTKSTCDYQDLQICYPIRPHQTTRNKTPKHFNSLQSC